MGFSNASVGYLNYPTQVIFKCCKLIPVLIGGIIIQGKRYNLLDFSAAVLMSLGLIMFSLADNKVSPNFDLRGYTMISLALVADAVIGNVQEKAMKTYAASNNEVVNFLIILKKKIICNLKVIFRCFIPIQLAHYTYLLEFFYLASSLMALFFFLW